MGSMAPATPEVKLLINGKFVDASDGGIFDLHSPYSGKLVGRIAEATAADVDSAVNAASKAFPAWSALSPAARGAPLAKLASLISDSKDTFAKLEAQSIGRATADFFDAHYASMQFGYFAQAAYATGHSSLNTPGFLNFSLRQPFGVVAAIIPWNAPLVFLSKKLGPALAAGNTVILKTSEKAPLSSDYVAKMLDQAGFPPGVVNVLHGHGQVSGEAICRHMRIRAVSFTGSVMTGRRIMRAAADTNFKRVILELGGKSPVVVFEDADLAAAAKETAFSILLNSGQTCMANSRVYVHDAVAAEFVKLFEEQIRSRKVGDPELSSTSFGTLADKGQWERVTSFVEKGRKELQQEGAVFLAAIPDVPEDSQLMKDEIFGPVVCINSFSDEAKVLAQCNDTEYGLYAAVYTKDLDRGMRVAKALESGMVGVNCTSPTGAWDLPFGGYKQSGVGREGFLDSLNDWLENKSVFMRVKGLESAAAASGPLGR
ncbi:Aldehyde dehydrogenase [Cyphellophora attinorum]|uniref:aldehyde dehydrogenase (NAD(+)) n=1 Tax=Cyphellophora attinorum TaxID=1664694 RepID=A0A0N1P0B3_9EURO|nr:Aldehyde dehydrogenase [Phialophora attinorum]KPI41973.1 Aldehyde dehydrogenase [Phialophora attinorum]